jgi:hypothetical protein
MKGNVTPTAKKITLGNLKKSLRKCTKKLYNAAIYKCQSDLKIVSRRFGQQLSLQTQKETNLILQAGRPKYSFIFG